MNLAGTLYELRNNLLDSIGKPPRHEYMADYLVAEYFAPGSNQNYDGWSRVQLRFDFEGGPLKYSKGGAVHIAVDNLVKDLGDLIENGDVQCSDVLLRSIDGAKKRGRQPSGVWVPGAMILEEWSKSRQQWEYIVYTVLYTEWRENEEG